MNKTDSSMGDDSNIDGILEDRDPHQLNQNIQVYHFKA